MKNPIAVAFKRAWHVEQISRASAAQAARAAKHAECNHDRSRYEQHWMQSWEFFTWITTCVLASATCEMDEWEDCGWFKKNRLGYVCDDCGADTFYVDYY